MILLCRIWLFYYTYAYDHHMLNFRNSNNSFIIKYHYRLGNEYFMLCTVGAIWFILSFSIILDQTVFKNHFGGFTQIYYGINFVGFVVLACFIPRKHDQLGLWIETVGYFILSVIAIIGLFIVQFTLEETPKRVILYLGGTMLIFGINFISAYISLYQYDGYKYSM